MKEKSRKPPYRLKTDSVAFQRAMDALDASGLTYYRPTDYLLKAGLWNYYPNKGTLQEDGRKKLSTPQTVGQFVQRLVAEARVAAKIAQEENKTRPGKRE